jgi:NAD(P)-dependent dehydrogenase (short-subunit alcohol dehydrogenase family)
MPMDDFVAWLAILIEGENPGGVRQMANRTAGSNAFEDKVAIVTGGASGIGQALCEELGRRGAAMVIVADINAEGAGQVASAIIANGGRARAAYLDVTKAEDVQKLVDETASEHGQLDYMFNNAGIAMCAEVRDMDLGHWRRIVDINLWGVIYGTTAAYQVMTKQRFGHIINTASLGGLIPESMATAYVTTKHAVVGLSTSLRIEAAELGVKVSIVCPGFVQTGVLDAATYVGIKREDAISEMSSSAQMMDVADCARVILRGVEHNKAIITDTALTRLFWWLYRLNPAIIDPLMRKGVSDMRALRIEP